jgi:hypothetical protein
MIGSGWIIILQLEEGLYQYTGRLEKRDSEICQQVQELAEQMKNSEDKPIRICVSNIGKSLGMRALLDAIWISFPKQLRIFRQLWNRIWSFD